MKSEIKIIHKSEANYFQSLQNQEDTYGVFWWDDNDQLKRAVGGFATFEEARKWWFEYLGEE